MAALGINKQLDLQSLLIQIARARAIDGGWYDNRRRYQMEFIVVVTLLGLIATTVLALACSAGCCSLSPGWACSRRSS